ncbi:MAG: hypothetical protein ACH349_05635 [Candidatus Rhabdochlamydia sp.]
MPPVQKTTEKSQRDEFSYQLGRAELPGIKPDDWGISSGIFLNIPRRAGY